MSELERLTQIITTIFSNNNQARNESEAILKKLQERDFNEYVSVFCNLLNGKSIYPMLLNKTFKYPRVKRSVFSV